VSECIRTQKHDIKNERECLVLVSNLDGQIEVIHSVFIMNIEAGETYERQARENGDLEI